MGEVASMTRLLQTTSISKRFGGLQAVQPVDFRLDQGEIRAIIGPNGAGKTTLVCMISGRIRPTSGQVQFKDRNITRLRAWDRVGLGIVYTFQVTSIFKNLTVYDNVALAVQRRLMLRALDRVTLRETVLSDGVEKALEDVGLKQVDNHQAGLLPYGHQKLLEVAMALALKPKLLILDEPTQGLAPEEIIDFCDLIRKISKKVTILLIEHNMPVVLELATGVTVMDKGAIIAVGTPDEIEADTRVQEAYLGL